MKAKQAVKKINKALDDDMDSVLMLGLESDHKSYHKLAYGEDETIINLIINFFEEEPEIADVILKVSAVKKLNRMIAASESEEED